MELEEHRHNLPNVAPVSRIIRLHEEQTTRHQRTMNLHEKLRRDKPALDLGRVIVRLRMIAMDLRHTARFHVLFQQPFSITNGEANVRQTALVAPAGSVTNNDGQDVDAKVIVIRPPDGTADEKSAVATTKIENDG